MKHGAVNELVGFAQVRLQAAQKTQFRSSGGFLHLFACWSFAHKLLQDFIDGGLKLSKRVTRSGRHYNLKLSDVFTRPLERKNVCGGLRIVDECLCQTSCSWS